MWSGMRKPVPRKFVLQWKDEQIDLMVQDDGTGFDAERIRGLGIWEWRSECITWAAS